MYWIIQIPCYNEAESLAIVLHSLPRCLPGINRIETLVIDDGSQDATLQVARGNGADHVLCLERHSGLAGAFYAGIQECLRLGADGIINLDADGQYDPADLTALTAPILMGQADMVVGDRCPGEIDYFSPIKRCLEVWGSKFISLIIGIPLPDAVCGLRAWNTMAARQISLQTRFSYTLSSLFQAKQNHLRISYVPVGFFPAARSSRLADSTMHFLLFTTIDLFYLLFNRKLIPPPIKEQVEV